MGTISDPATRALAAPAISNGLKYEVNPSVLLAAASVTDYGRKGKGRGYTNLGDGSEDGAKSIKQAARYLSEAGFHTDPDKAIRRLAKVTGNDPEQIRKTASGYTALDDAARKVEVAEGDTQVIGVGRFKYRKPEDRPSSRVARAARDAASAALNEAHNVDFADLQDVREARRENPAQFDGSTVPQAAAESRGKALNTQGTQLSKRGERQMAKVDAARAQATANVAEGASALVKALGAEPGPKPRKVAKKLVRATKRATPEVSGLSSPDQATFAAELAKQTGLSPRVVAAWVRQEGGNLNPGDNNWLNIGAFDSGFDQSIMGDPAFRDPKSAAKVTADFLRGKVYGASEGIQAILGAAGKGDQQQIAAIAGSGWATDPNYLENISRNYNEVSADPGKDIPKKLIQRANNVLGKPATKALLAGGKLVKASKGGKQKRPLKVEEMFYDKGISLDSDGSGKLVEIGPIGNHGGHVHVSSDDPFTILTVYKKAQELGMMAEGTGENPAFDTIDASHDPQGYHYHENPMPEGLKRLRRQTGAEGNVIGGALDIAGTPEQMAALNQWVAKNAGKNVAVPAPIPIKGTNLAVQPPAPPTTGTTGTSSGGVPSSGGAPALTAAMDAVDKARRGAAAVGGISPITSAAAAYARSSLNNDPSGDPIYEAFRPRR
ncbi:MAG: hypothetical protein HUU17_06125 [Chthonomonadales bacterium]|nr:hypothetical protein [Chthonomonadales bacterium]